jgi:hypothetical protein
MIFNKEFELGSKEDLKKLQNFLFRKNRKSKLTSINCTSDRFFKWLWKWFICKEYQVLIYIKSYLYQYIILFLLYLVNLFKLHNLVDEEYYPHQIYGWVKKCEIENKWYLGNFFGFNFFGIFEILGVIFGNLGHYLLIHFANGVDFKALYKIKYLISGTTSLDFYFLEKHSNVLKGKEILNVYEDKYNAVLSGVLLEQEYIFGMKALERDINLFRYYNHLITSPKDLVTQVNYFLNGITLGFYKPIYRIIQLETGIKIGIVWKTSNGPNTSKKYKERKNIIFLENCINFKNTKIFHIYEGLYFSNKK